MLNGGSSPGSQQAYYNTANGLLASTNLRGQQVTYSSNPGSVAVTVAGAGLSKTFASEPTRLGNAEDALNYLNSRYVAGLFNAIGGNSSANPAVGNPTSLVGTMVGNDFRIATGIGDFTPDVRGSTVAVPNAITVGGEFSYASTRGVDIRQVTLPLGYTVYFADPRYTLTIDMPLTYLNVGGSTVAQGSLGAAFKLPVLNNWSISVGGRGGAVGSLDLLLGDIAYSGTLGSQYRIDFGAYGVILGSAVSFVKTQGFKIHGISTGIDRNNVPIVNGLSVEGPLPVTLFDKPTSFEAYVIDTYYAGQTLPVQHYDEVGFNIGTARLPGDQSWNVARIGAAYTVGRSFNMVSLRASYRF